MNIKLLISIVSIAMMMSACSNPKVEPYTDQRDPVQVSIATVNTSSAHDELQLDGTVASDKVVDVSAKVMGFVQQLTLAPGDIISKGKLIARIKNEESNTKAQQIEAMIDEAQINLGAIQKDYDRIQRLFNQNSATQKELDDISTQMQVTKARINQLESSRREASIMTGYSEVRAPLSGTVISKYMDNGEMAAPGRPIVTIASSGDQLIKINIPENYIGYVSKNTPVQYKGSDDNKWSEGTISEVNTSAKYGQYEAEISLPRNSTYLDGMYMKVRIPLNKPESETMVNTQITVPKSAIIERGQLHGIFVPSDQNTALLRWVTIGESTANTVEVLSGLAPGEKYITEAQSRLINGIPISR